MVADLLIFAHEHYYARLHTVYNHKVHPNHGDTISDPIAPIHITTGCAGNREIHPAFNPIIVGKANHYIKYRILDYGL